ncbi:MAG: hypothetical protein K2P68_11680 [Sphingomonas sp.]|nr:hypothetical protein [Sphingomonas sp.]
MSLPDGVMIEWHRLPDAGRAFAETSAELIANTPDMQQVCGSGAAFQRNEPGNNAGIGALTLDRAGAGSRWRDRAKSFIRGRQESGCRRCRHHGLSHPSRPKNGPAARRLDRSGIIGLPVISKRLWQSHQVAAIVRLGNANRIKKSKILSPVLGRARPPLR